MKLELTLILKARLKPEAKKPPKGPITLLKIDNASEWNTNGYAVILFDSPTYIFKKNK